MHGILGVILAVVIVIAWAQHCSERPGGCCPGRNDECAPPGAFCFCDDYCREASDCCSDFPSGCNCSLDVKRLACEVQSNSHITLLTVNPSGVNDGADAKSNIQDTCNGGKARRSSYCCKAGCSPGGSICLSEKVLQYVLALANETHSIQVNSLAGACHSNTSHHYQGTAVDLQVFDESSHTAWMDKCGDMEAVENLGPGNPGHSSHTHCAF
ncbi:uncharacterized protein LOC110988675 [Acanthaster planci]|uniref:Uncharacterized protein LOC110988675 n=1 Tax=Acanthaster planci TaxID=133434 RepID=A0A8B7ZRU6_ACAPL|nr:uncharacterized protein LOC110988675 [Acanthaster planci]XP_022108119.1 uncharacterized protein LOC110988675 [Acanthaster planci]